MNKHVEMVLFGFLLWLVPFLASFPFVDSSGNYLVPETFFKTIMIVVGSLVGVILAVEYFRDVKTNYLKQGVLIGIVWLAINWFLDLSMVFGGMFQMSISQYFTDIGLRYLSIPFYTTGIGYLLQEKHKK